MTQKYSTHSLGRRERVTRPASHVVEREVRGHGRELAARALRRERGRLPREPVHLEQRSFVAVALPSQQGPPHSPSPGRVSRPLAAHLNALVGAAPDVVLVSSDARAFRHVLRHLSRARPKVSEGAVERSTRMISS